VYAHPPSCYHWVAVPKELRARRVNRDIRWWGRGSCSGTPKVRAGARRPPSLSRRAHHLPAAGSSVGIHGASIRRPLFCGRGTPAPDHLRPLAGAARGRGLRAAVHSPPGQGRALVRRPLRPATRCFDWDVPMRRLFLSRNIEGATDAGRDTSGHSSFYADSMFRPVEVPRG
jgi:hypothetical protein